MTLSQHPNDVPGVLTRAEIWARISIGLLLGVSLAVAKTGMEREDRKLQGLGECTSKDFLRAARTQGWRVQPTHKNHVLFFPKDKSFSPILIDPDTGDPRANKNNKAKFRKAGLVLDC